MKSIEPFGDRESSLFVGGTWSTAIGAAVTERDLVGVVRDYLATLSPAEIASLPESCRPGRINDGEDVSDLALMLSQAQIAPSATPAQVALLERIGTFFAHASARVTQILAARPT